MTLTSTMVAMEMETRVVDVTVDLAVGTYEVTVDDPVLGLIVVAGTFVNIEGIAGTEGDDTIYGSDGPDLFLHSGQGDDIIFGRGGNDENIDGGPGDDYLYGGPGDDGLHGDGGADHMYGGDGNDFLMSRSDEANDHMSGGPGCDTFILMRSFGTDTLTDFEDGCDVIDLSDYPQNLDINSLNITNSGSDIIIDFWLRKGGNRGGGTIIIKDGVTNGVLMDPSDFQF